MREWIFGIALVVMLGFAAPAMACEECGSYFDYQALEWCKICEPADCGMYQCVVRQSLNFEYCDPAAEVEGAEECFTERGYGYCGPDEDSRLTRQPRAWQLVKVELRQPEVRPRG